MIKRAACIAIFIAMTIPSHAAKSIRYVALGDSYTIGTGASPEESWPAAVTRRLQAKGVPIELAANLGHNGWTAQDVITGELPELDRLRPDLVTLLIGTNDWVHGVDEAAFRSHIHTILEQLHRRFKDPKAVLVLTIPDFSAMPNGPLYSGGRDISGGLAAFNRVLTAEAAAFGFQVIDLFALSHTLAGDPAYPSEDGLHPSARGYARWAEAIEGQFPF